MKNDDIFEKIKESPSLWRKIKRLSVNFVCIVVTICLRHCNLGVYNKRTVCALFPYHLMTQQILQFFPSLDITSRSPYYTNF